MGELTYVLDLSELSPYERQAWESIQRWQTADAKPSRVPETVRDKAKELGHH